MRGTWKVISFREAAVFIAVVAVSFAFFFNASEQVVPLVSDEVLLQSNPPKTHKADEILSGSGNNPYFGYLGSPALTTQSDYNFASTLIVNEQSFFGRIRFHPFPVKEAEFFTPLTVKKNAYFLEDVNVEGDLTDVNQARAGQFLTGVPVCRQVMVEASGSFDTTALDYCKTFFGDEYYPLMVTCDGIDGTSNNCDYPNEWDTSQDNCEEIDILDDSLESLCGGETDSFDDTLINCCEMPAGEEVCSTGPC